MRISDMYMDLDGGLRVISATFISEQDRRRLKKREQPSNALAQQWCDPIEDNIDKIFK